MTRREHDDEFVMVSWRMKRVGLIKLDKWATDRGLSRSEALRQIIPAGMKEKA